MSSQKSKCATLSLRGILHTKGIGNDNKSILIARSRRLGSESETIGKTNHLILRNLTFFPHRSVPCHYAQFVPEQQTLPQDVRQGLFAVEGEIDDVVEQGEHRGLRNLECS